jgi:hypothetical protein
MMNIVESSILVTSRLRRPASVEPPESCCKAKYLTCRDSTTSAITCTGESTTTRPTGRPFVSLREGNASESEDETGGNDDENQVIVSQQLRSRGNLKANQSAIRLTEIGPRMTLELVKIEEGLCDGEVLYHTHVSKSADEIAELRQRTMEKKRLKEQRKREQEVNVERKQAKKATPTNQQPTVDESTSSCDDE